MSRDALTALLEAAGTGDTSAVAHILDADPGLIDQRGTLPGNSGLRTALHFGAGHEPVVRLLLERGADPNIRDEGDNAYPIHFAAERGDVAIVRLLVEHGADPVGGGTTHGLDVLGWAVCFDYAFHEDVARYLLAHGAKHSLLTAVAMGDADAIASAARDGADLNQRMDRTNYQRTPLHLAVAKRQEGSLAALIALGADVNVMDAAGLTPLDYAALAGDREMIAALIDRGATVSLPAAIVLDRADAVDRALRDDPDTFSTTDNRRWAQWLTYASSRAPAAVLERLLRVVARHRSGLSIVNMADNQETAVDGAAGYTPLHAAAFHGNDAAVDVLMRHGADPRARDGKYCSTPAGWAAYAGHRATANRILDADVDIFDAINFDRGDRIASILDGDPAAVDRPFSAYAACPSREGQWWPAPDCTPLDWARKNDKTNAVRTLTERGAGTRTDEDIARARRMVTFLEFACWDHTVHGKADHRMHDRAAQRLLGHYREMARDNLYAAIVCGERDEVAKILKRKPESARARGGARGWTPILYLAYTRFSHPPTSQQALAIARLLLDHGADPNDFYMAGDSRYSVLTGVAGEGEQDSPRQPYAAALFELLVERGANPFDIQVLYNTHFSGDMLWWLDIVYRQTANSSLGSAWADPRWSMFDMGGYGSGARFLLEFAIKKHKADLAAWCLARGADPNAPPARDKRFPKHTLYQLAVLEDQPAIAELLAAHGATRSEPTLSDRERVVHACLCRDRAEVERILVDHPALRADPYPMFEAAKRNRPDVLAILLDLGFDIEAQDATGKRALHEAAAHNAVHAIAYLLDRGAEVDPIESTYGGTPIGWAAHGDHQEALDLLSRSSRSVWTLCYRGYVNRVREVLLADPALGRGVGRRGYTPFWWLPDDEDRALEVIDILLAAGARPEATVNGATAAGWARKRGMLRAAARLDEAARVSSSAGPDS